MENSYGIGVRNRYELFYDEEVDPLDLLKQTEKVKEKGPEKENKGKAANKTTTTTTTKDPAVKKATKTDPQQPKVAEKTSAPSEPGGKSSNQCCHRQISKISECVNNVG